MLSLYRLIIIVINNIYPIVFLSITVITSGRVYEDFERQFFLHGYHEVSILDGELPEESEQFRFFRVSHLSNLKGSVGLILTTDSVMWVTIPIDLSTWSFIPLPRFLNSRRVSPLLNQSLVLIPQQSDKVTHDVCYVQSFTDFLCIIYSFSVTFFTLWSSPFFILMQINEPHPSTQQ
jgi:hypothetical protein